MKIPQILLCCVSLAAAIQAQTEDKPVRAVTDPGVVTTRQAITPAGVPTVFKGRVYGVAFGANSSELWVLNATRVYRLDWNQNRVLDNAPINATPGLQAIRFDAGRGAPLFSLTRKGKVELGTIGDGGAENSQHFVWRRMDHHPQRAAGHQVTAEHADEKNDKAANLKHENPQNPGPQY